MLLFHVSAELIKSACLVSVDDTAVPALRSHLMLSLAEAAQHADNKRSSSTLRCWC